MKLFERFNFGLSKTANGIKNSLSSVFIKNKIDPEQLNALEDSLILSDIGLECSAKLIQNLKNKKVSSIKDENELLELLSSGIEDILNPVTIPLKVNIENKPHVIILVGVNGSGKTTTAAKLASIFKKDGKTVLLAACDTFRAAATDQLEVWGERIGIEVMSGEKFSDPASLAYKALSYAQEKSFDVLLIDTAGRLQVKEDLMQELEKIERVLGKKLPGCPNDKVIVLDGSTGQNAHSQIQEFRKKINLSGIIITKLDGTAKGGVVVSLADKYGLPIHAIGVGEKEDDLTPFNSKHFSRAILGLKEEEE